MGDNGQRVYVGPWRERRNDGAQCRVVVAIDADKSHVGGVEYDKETDLRAWPEAWTAREVVLLAAALAARDERVRELEAELAAVRPKAEAAERWARAHRALDDEIDAGDEFSARIVEFQAARDAILAACPEKGGAR